MRAEDYLRPSEHIGLDWIGMQDVESCQGNLRKVKCGTFCKLPLVAFPHSAAKKFRISVDRKTAVHLHCTIDVHCATDA